MFFTTGQPLPYYAVIFTSTRTAGDNGYNTMADKMLVLASEQDGFLGADSAREELGITVSYWRDLQAIANWKKNMQHQQAQNMGREHWYQDFTVRIAKVEREYSK
jgi:heme-degrading monooxygenase HmoA